MDAVGAAAAAWPLDPADVSVAREDLAAEPLPGCGRVAAVAHGSNDAWLLGLNDNRARRNRS